MSYYDNWETLTTAAQENCTAILKKDVFPVAKKIVKKHIQSDIYKAYTPTPNGWVNGETYKRRKLLPNTIEYIFVADDEMYITSNADASPSVVKGYSFQNRRPGAFLELLESGKMGIWKKGFPRPAISNAQKEIDNSTEITDAIQKGINKRFHG
jgi:hypothetical protein